MGNDLKYGLVLGAVVLLIFVGYYAIRSQSSKEEIRRPATVKKVEPPVNIFDTPGTTAATPSGTAALPTPTATFEFGPTPAATTAPTYAATPAGTGLRTATPGLAPGPTPAGTFPRYTPAGTYAAVPGPGVTPAGTGLAPVRGIGLAPAPLPSLTPPSGSTRTYKIAKGDTLAEISKKFYGTAGKWQKILDANRGKNLNPTNLVIGTEIVIPDVASEGAAPGLERLSERAGTAEHGKTHTVATSDTLYGIAKKYYGDGTQWKKIYEANKSKISDPDVLQPGTVLTIP